MDGAEHHRRRAARDSRVSSASSRGRCSTARIATTSGRPLASKNGLLRCGALSSTPCAPRYGAARSIYASGERQTQRHAFAGEPLCGADSEQRRRWRRRRRRCPLTTNNTQRRERKTPSWAAGHSILERLTNAHILRRQSSQKLHLALQVSDSALVPAPRHARSYEEHWRLERGELKEHPAALSVRAGKLQRDCYPPQNQPLWSVCSTQCLRSFFTPRGSIAKLGIARVHDYPPPAMTTARR